MSAVARCAPVASAAPVGVNSRKPGDDLLSHLIETGLDGEDLTVDDFRAIVASLAARAV